MERLDASLLKWLKLIEETESNVSQANASIDQKTATLQNTIILVQDNLSQDNDIGQHALRRTIDTAEKYYRVARQFNRVAGDVMCAGEIARQLVETIRALRLSDLPSLIGPMPNPTNISTVQEPGFITRQLAKLKLDLDRLSTRPNIISTHQVLECIANFEPVMTLLSLQAIDICSELRRHTDEIDRLVWLITQSLTTNAARRP